MQPQDLKATSPSDTQFTRLPPPIFSTQTPPIPNPDDYPIAPEWNGFGGLLSPIIIIQSITVAIAERRALFGVERRLLRCAVSVREVKILLTVRHILLK